MTPARKSIVTRIDEYAAKLTASEKTFLQGYLPDINRILSDLDNRSALIKTRPTAEVTLIQDFIRTQNILILFKNELFNIVDDEQKFQAASQHLAAAGLSMNDFAEKIGGLMCHSYQICTERLKMNLKIFINFAILQYGGRDLGGYLHTLKQIYPNNNLLSFFDTQIRNSIAHYSYCFRNGELFFYKDFRDQNPIRMALHDFMRESKHMSILTEAFFLAFLDYAHPGGSLTLANP